MIKLDDMAGHLAEALIASILLMVLLAVWTLIGRLAWFVVFGTPE